MAGRSSKTGVTPGWYDPELPHVWLPYAQMKTVSPPLAGRAHARRPHFSCRRTRTDRRHRELVDGLPWLQSPAHPASSRDAARVDAARDVRRAGARAGADGLPRRLAPAAARRSGAGIFLRLRIGRGRDRHEDGDAILDQPRSARQKTVRRFSRADITATHSARWRSAIWTPACTPVLPAFCPSITSSTCRKILPRPLRSTNC